MKTTLLFLFTALQAGFLLAQVEQFDSNYYGQYRSEDGESFYYFAEYEGDLDQFLTEDQQKNVEFFFSYEGPTDMFGGVAMKKGNSYVSHVNDATPEVTFAFKNDSDLPTVIVTDKSGQKLTFNKIDFSAYYYDGENSDVGFYGDEETMDVLSSMRVYSRSDGAELAVIFTEETYVFAVHIPATKSCAELTLEGDLVGGGEEGLYVYNDPEGKFVLNMIEMENTMQFECVKGDCFDKKGKCGIWKEIFTQTD